MRKLIGIVLFLISIVALISNMNPVIWFGSFFLGTLFLWEFWVGFFLGRIFFN